MRLLILFSLLFILVSCKEETPELEDNTYYVEFALDGTTIRYENGVNGYGNGPGRISYADNVGPLNSQFTLFSTDTSDVNFGKNILKIQMIELKVDSIVPTYTETFVLFNEGTYAFGSAIEDSITGGTNGALIEYIDVDSTVWTSDVEIDAQPSNSRFEITSHKAVDNPLFGGATRGNFNCRLHDSEGNSVEITNGSFHARTIFKDQ